MWYEGTHDFSWITVHTRNVEVVFGHLLFAVFIHPFSPLGWHASFSENESTDM